MMLNSHSSAKQKHGGCDIIPGENPGYPSTEHREHRFITTDYKSLNGILYLQLHYYYDSATLHLTTVIGLLEIHGCYRNFAFDCYWIVINPYAIHASFILPV